jgi:hypothetical protein
VWFFPFGKISTFHPPHSANALTSGDGTKEKNFPKAKITHSPFIISHSFLGACLEFNQSAASGKFRSALRQNFYT